MPTGQEISSLIGQLFLLLSGTGGVAFLLFQFLGKKWIENKFAESLENHRHQQALEIQRLRVEIDALLSGTIRLQEHEFKVLPELWERLHTAYSQVGALISPVQSYPDLDRLNIKQLEEFLAKSDLRESDKDEIRVAPNKVGTYEKTIFWYRVNDCRRKMQDLHQYIARYGIFLPAGLKDKLEALAREIGLCLSIKQHAVSMNEGPLDQAWEKLEAAKPLYEGIERLIQERLRSHGQDRSDQVD